MSEKTQDPVEVSKDQKVGEGLEDSGKQEEQVKEEKTQLGNVKSPNSDDEKSKQDDSSGSENDLNEKQTVVSNEQHVPQKENGASNEEQDLSNKEQISSSEEQIPSHQGQTNDNSSQVQSSENSVTQNNAQAVYGYSEWRTVWDNTTQAYYYWNTVTNETSWQAPAGYLEACANQISTGQNTENNGIYASQQDYYNNYYAHYGYFPEEYQFYDTTPATTTTTTATTPPPTSNPLDSLLDKIDKEVKTKLDGPSGSSSQTADNNSQNDPITQSFYNSLETDTTDDQSEYDAFMAQHGSGEYTVQARFNVKTGRFQRDPTLNPERFSSDAKAVRQMSYFFDYESFSQERGTKRLKGDSEKSTKLSKKDIELLKERKKLKKEMKKRAWLLGED